MNDPKANQFLMRERQRLLAEAETTSRRIADACQRVTALLDEPDIEKLKAALKEILDFVSAPEIERRKAELKAQLAALEK